MSLSWENPRNVKEIAGVCRDAILQQWMIPAILPPDNQGWYQNESDPDSTDTMIVSTYRRKYRITIELIEDRSQ
jgi:hypothetical protein